jgi:hypothetical protein
MTDLIPEPSDRLTAIRERAAERRRVREELNQVRSYGLRIRHRNKLAHLRARREGENES